MKVQVSVPDGLLQRIDAYCEKNRYTRSGFISLCVSQYLDAKEITPEVNQQFSDGLKAISDLVANKTTLEETNSRLDEIAARIKELADGIPKE